VPELASRAHQSHIVPVVTAALQEAGIEISHIDAVAFTQGPGLVGSLLVGISFAKGFALAQNIPLIAVNHMQAHVAANYIQHPQPLFPFLCLTVSGGHTQLVLVKDYMDMELIGQTIDDAAGEAFDKAAKMLELAYPGGPLIDQYAATGNAKAFSFSKSNLPQLDFSFSGLKTSILYFLQKQEKVNPNFVQENLSDLCASIQGHIIDMLMEKLQKAIKMHRVQAIALAGGVSANSGLRTAFQQMAHKNSLQAYIPAFQYCTDNAAMIAVVGHHKYQIGDFADQTTLPSARYPF
jgi:N6-L-threonylcarbamoyladenine synthase